MTHETRYDDVMKTTRYEILIDATCTTTLLALDAHFTNVDFRPAPESSIMSYAAFDATDDALDAYCSRFGIDADQRDEIFDLA